MHLTCLYLSSLIPKMKNLCGSFRIILWMSPNYWPFTFHCTWEERGLLAFWVWRTSPPIQWSTCFTELRLQSQKTIFAVSLLLPLQMAPDCRDRASLHPSLLERVIVTTQQVTNSTQPTGGGCGITHLIKHNPWQIEVLRTLVKWLGKNTILFAK